ncbi:hypothetical protein ACN47E_000706 [Coniothyrium glycines]
MQDAAALAKWRMRKKRFGCRHRFCAAAFGNPPVLCADSGQDSHCQRPAPPPRAALSSVPLRSRRACSLVQRRPEPGRIPTNCPSPTSPFALQSTPLIRLAPFRSVPQLVSVFASFTPDLATIFRRSPRPARVIPTATGRNQGTLADETLYPRTLV